jgi:riboflavin-specific deaminase-like protein
MLTVHFAQTLDGRIATSTGDSQWISCQASLRFAHRLRSEHDAVMVGIGTVLADDPKLTVRLVTGRSPVRVVLDSGLRIPYEAQLLDIRETRTIIATTQRADKERAAAIERTGAEVLLMGTDSDGRVDLRQLIDELYRRGLQSILIEGGPSLITAALRGGLVDRLAITIAPKIIGEGKPAIGDLGIRMLGQAITFSESHFESCAEDMIFDGRPVRDRISAA